MKERPSRPYFWKSTILTFAILMNITLGYSLFLGNQSVFVWRNLHERYREIVVDLELVNEKKTSLSQEIRLLQNDPAAIERLIRQRLNYVREDEVLYIFEKNTVEDSPWEDNTEGEIKTN